AQQQLQKFRQMQALADWTQAQIDSKKTVGIGPIFQRDPKGDGLSVRDIVAGSPAAKCPKIQVGDVMVSVDGKSFAKAKLKEINDALLGAPGSKVKMFFKSKTLGKTYQVL
ncbi:hypothetical protein T484DRAFT_1768245, partial [Baffinella frigidus]